MSNKNPNAWEYNGNPHTVYAPGEWRYRVVQVVREHKHRTAFYDDPENENIVV